MVLTIATVALGASLVLVLMALGREGIDGERRWSWTPDWLTGEGEAAPDRDLVPGPAAPPDTGDAPPVTPLDA
jgi:hypothetical protein